METEKEYRAFPAHSSSSIKDFYSDKRKYYKRHILKEPYKEKPNAAANMGILVETLLMEEERFDELFHMSSLVSTPGGMLGDFIYFLAEIVAKEGEKSDFDFKEATQAAYDKSGYKTKIETVLKKLDLPENQIFYNERLQIERYNLTLITTQDVENAEKIIKGLRESKSIGPIVNLKSGTEFTVINQFKISGFQIEGLDFKGMLDKVIINHVKKTVSIYDLKCVWSVETFYKDYYLYRYAYIQAYVYYMAVLHLTETPSHEFYGYHVEFPAFIVCDSINYHDPLLYTMTQRDIIDAKEGFTYKYNTYKGVKELLTELKWHIENDIWTMSYNAFKNNGVLNIKEGVKK
jgi:hypothetical protein